MVLLMLPYEGPCGLYLAVFGVSERLVAGCWLQVVMQSLALGT